MTAPVKSKTWQYSVNNVVGGGTVLAVGQNTLHGIKAAMCAFGTNPWTVVRSSDSVSSGAADYWLAPANLIWSAAGARSWIVLKQAGMLGANVQILFACSNANAYNLYVSMSPSAGFTGGNTTTNPSATDEVVLNTAASAWGIWSTAVQTVYHVSQSTDGKSTKIFICRQNVVSGRMEICDIVSPVPTVATWTNAVCGIAYGTSSNATEIVTYANEGLNTGRWVGRYLSTAVNFIPSSMSTGLAANNMAGQMYGIDDITSEYNVYPVGLYSITAGTRGDRGQIADLWFVADSLNTGDCTPAGGARDFAVFGMVLTPWDGSLPVIT